MHSAAPLFLFLFFVLSRILRYIGQGHLAGYSTAPDSSPSLKARLCHISVPSPPTGSGFGHATYSGQWNIHKQGTGRALGSASVTRFSCFCTLPSLREHACLRMEGTRARAKSQQSRPSSAENQPSPKNCK